MHQSHQNSRGSDLGTEGIRAGAEKARLTTTGRVERLG
jgi:hypothetical protein